MQQQLLQQQQPQWRQQNAAQLSTASQNPATGTVWPIQSTRNVSQTSHHMMETSLSKEPVWNALLTTNALDKVVTLQLTPVQQRQDKLIPTLQRQMPLLVSSILCIRIRESLEGFKLVGQVLLRSFQTQGQFKQFQSELAFNPIISGETTLSC